VLAAKRVFAAIEDLVESEQVGDLPLRGFSRPVPAVALLKLRGA
jgi:class 3 adenylate cyclase